MDRRAFIKSTCISGAWLMSFSVTGFAQKEQTNKTGWSLYISIQPDNSVIMESPVMEAGQFMRTTGPMMIADEMDLEWQSIQFSEATLAPLIRDENNKLLYRYAKINTGGSFSVRWTWDYLRHCGATARYLLMLEAGQRLKVPISELYSSRNFVLQRNSDIKIPYGDLAEQASKRTVERHRVRLKNKSNFTIIGTEKKNIDAKAIVTGKPLYGIDTDYPGCLQVVVDRAPALGADIKQYNRKAALAIPGVRQVVEIEKSEKAHFMSNQPQPLVASGIAVVADSLWAALQGKTALNTQWINTSSYKDLNSENELKKLHRQVDNPEQTRETLQNTGNIEAALQAADTVLEQQYEKPLFGHVLMEPFNAIVDLKADSATIITGHQNPMLIAEEVERLTGINALNVAITCKRMGGAFGRRFETDWICEAIKIAQKVQAPIKVTWLREDEIEQDYFDPGAVAKIRAGVKKGKVIAWDYCQSQTKAGVQDSCFPHGLVENYRVQRCKHETLIPAGPWRGPQHLFWAFANESMIDELAYKSKQDPLQFRLNMLLPERELPYTNWGASVKNSGRMAECFQAAAKQARWNMVRPKGRGLGIAGHFCHGSYAAFVVEVSVIDNILKIHQAWGAIDCGLPINPNHIRAQMEGGFIDGLNAALFNKINMVEGAVQNNQFGLLKMGLMKHAPYKIHTQIIANDYEPTGVGEPPTAPAMAALVNAIFAASGIRIRSLPVSEILALEA